MISATYRLQLHKDFGFDDARAILDYLDALGVSHLYTSPYFVSQPGSTHGYDLVDPKRLNPEIGSEVAYVALTDALAARGMGHVVDFVPNHMAASTENPWWRRVLENGPASVYADYFDIEWNPPKEALRNKVLLPVLGGQYGEVLEKGELTLERTGGAFSIRYYEHAFPVNPNTYAPVLERALARLDLPEDDPRRQDLESVVSGFAKLEDEIGKDRAREKEVLKRRLATLAEDSLVARALDEEVARMKGTPGTPESFDDLDRLIVLQSYRLAYWRVAAEEINYRRFFEINGLAAIKMETDPVFNDMHELLLKLVAEGRIQGVRLDHIDGLYDPEAYFLKLRAALETARATSGATEPIWLVIEKILTGNESLPATWAVDGTTGYDFVASLNGLFVDPRAEEPMTRLYRDLTGDTLSYAQHVHEAKRAILRSSLASELQMLAVRLERIAAHDRRSRDFTLATLRRALGETLAAFPIYRTYVRPDGSSEPTDHQIVARALRSARRSNPELTPSVFTFLKDALLLEHGSTDPERVELAMRFQQLTGPVVAKGIEDTTFYRFVRFIGLNEVGANPSHFGTSLGGFHAMNREHHAKTPRTMTSSTTHDTKRGEDVRARLAVLSEIPSLWVAWVNEWSDLVAPHTTASRDEEDEVTEAIPSPKDQLIFFQTVLGAFPLVGMPGARFIDRIQGYMVKAMREAKQHTSWLSPDEAYESAVRSFVAKSLADGAFLASLAARSKTIASYGASNGLAQTLVKIASPGIVDTYQGSETWDLRLVDPDNRTPVDYPALRLALRSLEGAKPAELLAAFEDGRIKLHVLTRALRLRRSKPAIFVDGDYHPLEAGDEIVAFVREHEEGTAVCLAARFPWRVTKGEARWAIGDVWTRTIPVPEGRYVDVLTDRTIEVGSEGVAAAKVFRDLPVALLLLDE